jgi:ComF family protein
MNRWMPRSIHRRLLPHICLLCDQVCSADANVDLCHHCRQVLPWNRVACLRCAIPMDTSQHAQICRSCRDQSPSYQQCVAPLLYTDQPRLWVQRLKFQHGLVEARLLGTLLADAVLDQYREQALPDVLVPVPLSLRRLVRRGHNQALSLATVVARRVNRPVYRHRVTRVKHGPSQRGSSRQARQSNLIDAFASRRWQGQCVALVDDVMTTGATLQALADVLLEAGASAVHGWCATRTADVAPAAD